MLRRLAIAAILALSLGAAIAELFDSWDQALPTGNDTEANVVVVALCVGVAFAIGTILIVNYVRGLASRTPRRGGLGAIRRELTAFLVPAPTVSPPTILRV